MMDGAYIHRLIHVVLMQSRICMIKVMVKVSQLYIVSSTVRGVCVPLQIFGSIAI